MSDPGSRVIVLPLPENRTEVSPEIVPELITEDDPAPKNIEVPDVLIAPLLTIVPCPPMTIAVLFAVCTIKPLLLMTASALATIAFEDENDPFDVMLPELTTSRRRDPSDTIPLSPTMTPALVTLAPRPRTATLPAAAIVPLAVLLTVRNPSKLRIPYWPALIV